MDTAKSIILVILAIPAALVMLAIFAGLLILLYKAALNVFEWYDGGYHPIRAIASILGIVIGVPATIAIYFWSEKESAQWRARKCEEVQAMRRGIAFLMSLQNHHRALSEHASWETILKTIRHSLEENGGVVSQSCWLNLQVALESYEDNASGMRWGFVVSHQDLQESLAGCREVFREYAKTVPARRSWEGDLVRTPSRLVHATCDLSLCFYTLLGELVRLELLLRNVSTEIDTAIIELVPSLAGADGGASAIVGKAEGVRRHAGQEGVGLRSAVRRLFAKLWGRPRAQIKRQNTPPTVSQRSAAKRRRKPPSS